MTLNTFHMAGRGEANVTLGIPRLREILMTAAASIKTPVMTLPLHPGLGPEAAADLAVRLKRIRLAEALRSMHVEENVIARTNAVAFGRGRVYTVRMQFHHVELYPAELDVRWEEIAGCFQREFVPKLQAAVKAAIKRASSLGAKSIAAPVAAARVGGAEEGGAAPLTSEEAAPKRRRRSEKDDEDENAEEDEQYQEGKLRFAGGRGEQATYGAGDEEDAEIQRQIDQEARRRQEEGSDDEDEQPVAADEGEGEEGEGSLARGGGSKMGKGPGLETGMGVDEAALACEVAITVPLDCPKLLMREIVEKVAAETIMRGVPGVSKSYTLEAGPGGAQTLQTDGINIRGVWPHQDLIDCNRLSTNNPAAMLAAYGVEACRATIVREVSSVFGAYGIGVDPRHLSLIADFMTHLGGYRACNRIGIEACTSPFLKISFETAASFLVSATLHGDVDSLTSPAARIVLGRPVGVGTGCLDLVQNMGAAAQAAQVAC
ncbi:hypothetical protein ABPG75_003968 [Micractinium tetrahymenae]